MTGNDAPAGFLLSRALEEFANALLARGNDTDVLLISQLFTRLREIGVNVNRRSVPPYGPPDEVESEPERPVWGLEGLSPEQIKRVASQHWSLAGDEFLVLFEAAHRLLDQYRATLVDGTANVVDLDAYNRLMRTLVHQARLVHDAASWKQPATTDGSS